MTTSAGRKVDNELTSLCWIAMLSVSVGVVIAAWTHHIFAFEVVGVSSFGKQMLLRCCHRCVYELDAGVNVLRF